MCGRTPAPNGPHGPRGTGPPALSLSLPVREMKAVSRPPAQQRAFVAAVHVVARTSLARATGAWGGRAGQEGQGRGLQLAGPPRSLQTTFTGAAGRADVVFRSSGTFRDALRGSTAPREVGREHPVGNSRPLRLSAPGSTPRWRGGRGVTAHDQSPSHLQEKRLPGRPGRPTRDVIFLHPLSSQSHLRAGCNIT